MVIKLLIVDDIADTREKLRMSLKDLDESYEIEEASGGRECLEKVKKKRPDLILMDVLMPDLDGFQTTMGLKKEPFTRKIPVIFLTVRTDFMSRRVGKILGQDYLLKPFRPKEVDEAIKACFYGEKED